MVKKSLFAATLLVAQCAPLVLRGQAAMPLIANKGQWPGKVLYRATITGGYLYFERDGLTYDFYNAQQVKAHFAGHRGKPPDTTVQKLDHHAYRVSFAGHNKEVHVKATQKLTPYFNYFLGNNPSKWAGNVPCYANVEYENVYPGINFSFSGRKGQIKLNIDVAAGADPSAIAFRYKGIDKMRLGNKGLRLTTSVNQVIESPPESWYANGHKLASRYSKRQQTIGFEFPGGIDASRSITIDPLIFSTYSGSFSDNFGYSATFDKEGFLYSGSSAFGNSYPTTTGAYQTQWHGGDGLGTGTDIALTKYDTSGTQLVYSTYLGGQNDELPHSLVVNEDDELVVMGTSASPDFPVTISNIEFQGGAPFTPSGIGVNYINGCDIVISRLSADGGDLLASRYWSQGHNNAGLNTTPDFKFNYADEIRGEVDLGPDGNVFVGSSLKTPEGNSEGVVMKLPPSLETVEWTHFVSSEENVAIYAIDFGLNGEIIYCGGVDAPGLSDVSGSAYQPTFAGGTADGFIGVLEEDGGTPGILYGTYYGSVAYDQFYLVEYDTQGYPHAYGQTRSGGTQLIENVDYSVANSSMLLSKFTPALDDVVWSTKFGTTDNKPNLSPTAFLVDLCNRIYLSGWGGNTNLSQNPNTNSTTGLPVTPDAFQSSTDGSDFYLMILDTDASELLYGSFFGGALSSEHVDGGTSRFDRSGKIYQSVCAGCGGNSDFPIEPDDAWSSTNNSFNCNNAVFKFDFGLPIALADFQATDVCLPDSVYFGNLSEGEESAEYQWTFGDGDESQETSPTHFYAQPGTYPVQLVINDSASCNFTDTLTKTIHVYPELTLDVTGDMVSCDSSSFTLSASSSGSSDSLLWAGDPDFQNILSEDATDSIVSITPTSAGYYYAFASNGLCRHIDSVYISPAPQTGLQVSSTQLCQGDTAAISLINLLPGVPLMSYNWSAGGAIVGGQSTSTIEVAGEGNIQVSVEAMSESGCTINDTLVLSYFPIELALPGDTVLCEANPLNLNAVTNGTGQSVVWSNLPDFSNVLNPGGEAMITVEPAEPATYYAQVQNGPCTLSDSVQVTLFNLNLSGTNRFICAQDTAQLNVSTSVNDPGLEVNWQPDSLVLTGQHTNTITASPNETTTFEVDITNQTGCQASIDMELGVSQLPDSVVASAQPPAITTNETSTLVGSPQNDLLLYEWTPADNLENPQSPFTTAQPSVTTTYALTITDSQLYGACLKSDSVTITVYDVNCGPPNIFVPNAFTPNGDGENDQLLVRGHNLSKVHLSIYNRWGERVFETHDKEEGWDGTYKGKDADPAVFVYYLEAGCTGGQEYFEKGNISLIR